MNTRPALFVFTYTTSIPTIHMTAALPSRWPTRICLDKTLQAHRFLLHDALTLHCQHTHTLRIRKRSASRTHARWLNCWLLRVKSTPVMLKRCGSSRKRRRCGRSPREVYVRVLCGCTERACQERLTPLFSACLAAVGDTRTELHARSHG